MRDQDGKIDLNISETHPLFTRRELLLSAAGGLASVLAPGLVMPVRAQSPFTWAVGIEDTFIPQNTNGLRALDEYDLTQHYTQWRHDLELVASLGVNKVRWGVPWYRVERAQGAFDWSWVDSVISYMTELRISPIIDLVHYGTPLWLTKSFFDPDYPKYVERYASIFVSRYGQKATWYTPMNEPAIAADMCCRRGQWPPYGRGEDSYVHGLLNMVRGMQATIKAIRRGVSNSTIVACEAMSEYLAAPGAEREGQLAFLRDLLPWDLTRGAVTKNHPLRGWLTLHGATEEELDVIARKGAEQDILGVNFYPWSIRSLKVDAAHRPVFSTAHGDGTMLKDILQRTYAYTHKQLFVTETSAAGDINERKKWMEDTIDAVRAARASGVPVNGYTWFPFYTMINWDYRSNGRPIDQNYLHLGLWDASMDANGVFVRNETPLVEAYKGLISSFR